MNAAILLIDMESYPDEAFLGNRFSAQIGTQIEVLKALADKPQVVLEYYELGGLPIDYSSPRTLPRISKHLRSDAQFVWKNVDDGFKGTELHQSKLLTHIGRFTNTSLEAIFQEMGVKDLVVMGYERNYCVARTVRSAVDKNYIVHTAEDVLCADSASDLRYNDLYFKHPQVKLYPSAAELIEALK